MVYMLYCPSFGYCCGSFCFVRHCVVCRFQFPSSRSICHFLNAVFLFLTAICTSSAHHQVSSFLSLLTSCRATCLLCCSILGMFLIMIFISSIDGGVLFLLRASSLWYVSRSHIECLFLYHQYCHR